MKKIVSALLISLLLLSLVFYAFATVNFTDIDQNSWYYEGVQYAVNNNLFQGTSTTTFSPDAPMTRAMMVTVLWRSIGSPEYSIPSGFNDVKTGSYFENATNWAFDNGFVNGVGNHQFKPDDNITREQFVAILYRFAKACGYDLKNTEDISSFDDFSRISNYAKNPLSWAVANNIIKGVGNNLLEPQGKATRAQVATILMRFFQLKPAHQHVYHIDEMKTQLRHEASCTEGESYWDICDCGARSTVNYQMYGEALGHDMKTIKVNPTQTEDGYDEHTCTRCGYTYRDHYTSLTRPIYDIYEAMEVGNNLAASLGFTLNYSYTPDSAGFYPPSNRSGESITNYGGQSDLNELARSKVQACYDHLTANGVIVSDGGISGRCYIEYDNSRDNYRVMFLYN